jgi:SAM-dependent methyltransferase
MTRCGDCALVYLNPRPTERSLAESYQCYFSPDPAVRAAYDDVMIPVFNASAEALRARHPRPGRVLDIGCGTGAFLSRMKQIGWSAEGCDPCRVQFANQSMNDDSIRIGNFEDLEYPDNHFDVVTAFFVIEHVVDPHAFVAKAWRHLKPGGTLLLFWPHTTPILRFAHLLGHGCNLYHMPWHLQDFSPSHMNQLLTGNQFRDVRTSAFCGTRPPSGPARWWNRFGLAVAATLERITGGRAVLPGLSKATFARKSP